MTRVLLLAGALLATAALSARADTPAFQAWWKGQLLRYQQAKTLDEKLAVVRALGARTEAQAGRLLVGVLGERPPEVGIAAAQELALARHAKLVPQLAAALAQSKGQLRLEVELVDTLGATGDPAAVSALVALFHRNELVLVRRTLRALERIKAPASVKPMMRYMVELFPNKQTRELNPQQFPWTRYRELSRPMLDALEAITGKRFETLEEWQSWYNDNKDRFS